MSDKFDAAYFSNDKNEIMKNYSIILICFIMLPFTSSAQQAPKKGYYAIGDNYKKLPGHAFAIHDSTIFRKSTKGYYAIENHHEQLPPALVWKQKKKATQKTRKGYYAIGQMPNQIITNP
jgi:hypothetical protein